MSTEPTTDLDWEGVFKEETMGSTTPPRFNHSCILYRGRHRYPSLFGIIANRSSDLMEEAKNIAISRTRNYGWTTPHTFNYLSAYDGTILLDPTYRNTCISFEARVQHFIDRIIIKQSQCWHTYLNESKDLVPSVTKQRWIGIDKADLLRSIIILTDCQWLGIRLSNTYFDHCCILRIEL